MAKTAYSFRIAYQSEEELRQLQEQGNQVDPETLVLTTLPDGQPSYKTLYASGETEDEAIRKVDAYVSKTAYREIEDGKTIQ